MIAFFSIILLGVACKKEAEDVLDEYAEDTMIFPEDLGDYDGLFLAVRNYIGNVEVENKAITQDFAYAQMMNPDFVDVGAVLLNGSLLVKLPTHQYFSLLDNHDFKLNEGKQSKWEIKGGNGFQQFSKSLSIRMPGLVTFKESPSAINLAESITLRIEDYPSHADGVIWILRDIDEKTIQIESKTTEVTISAAELGELRPGAKSLIKVVAYSTEKWENGGKKYVFLNETAEVLNVAFN